MSFSGKMIDYRGTLKHFNGMSTFNCVFKRSSVALDLGEVHRELSHKHFLNRVGSEAREADLDVAANRHSAFVIDNNSQFIQY